MLPLFLLTKLICCFGIALGRGASSSSFLIDSSLSDVMFKDKVTGKAYMSHVALCRIYFWCENVGLSVSGESNISWHRCLTFHKAHYSPELICQDFA